jgi:hypothetical protein
MAFPTDIYTSADLTVLSPTLWGEQVNNFFKEALVLGNFFTDRSDELSGGGSTIYTPNLTEMSSNTKTNGAAVTLNSPTETKQDLVVSTWKEVSFVIEDREAAQLKRSYNLQETMVRNAAHTVATDLEVALATLFSGFSNSVGSSTTNIADSDILAALAILETNSVPGIYTGEVAFFMHPNTFYRQVQAINKFALATNAPVQDPVAKKPRPQLYGIPVYISPNIQAISGGNGRYNAIAHKDALHWARQSLPTTGNSMVGSMGVRMQTNYIPEYLGYMTTADLCYGVVENRDNAGVRILTHATSV